MPTKTVGTYAPPAVYPGAIQSFALRQAAPFSSQDQPGLSWHYWRKLDGATSALRRSASQQAENQPCQDG